MKSFARYISEAKTPKVKLSPATEKIKQQKKAREVLADKIRKNPLTLCRVLSEKTSETFVNMLRYDTDAAIRIWMEKLLGNRTPRGDEFYRLQNDVYSSHRKLYKVVENLRDWFDSIGGRKGQMSSHIMEILACKDRANWASWQGKAYRGLSRSLARVKEYSYTGEVVVKEGQSYLVASVKYKSKYPIQSWTDEWKTAYMFAAELGGGDYGVILETNLTRKETILSPDVIRKISEYGSDEREVIRYRDTPETVKAYVLVSPIIDQIRTKKPSMKDTKESFTKRIVDTCLVPVVGEKAAKKVMSGKNLISMTIGDIVNVEMKHR